jgi:beta-glucosidase
MTGYFARVCRKIAGRPDCAVYALAILAVFILAPVRSAAAAEPETPGVAHPGLWPEVKRGRLINPTVEAQIRDLLKRLDTEEKVGQIIQGDISTITPEDLRHYPLGSVLAGGNSGPGGNARAPVEQWITLVGAFHTAALETRPGHVPVPLLFGVDAVHGHNKIIGATVFPHNVGLGAARDPDLVRRIGQATAEEVAATGIDWAFAPTVAVVRDVRWGRSYESYSEGPEIVRDYAPAMVSGVQGEPGTRDFLRPPHVIASVKHFLGDGGTAEGRDQGDNLSSEADLIRLHAAGYVPAIAAGAASVMSSFSSWQGVKMTANKGLLTDVLKTRFAFDGFLIDDWNAHGQVPGCTKSDCPIAIDAGIDVLMAPDSWKPLYENTLAEVRSGRIAMARLDDAVTRVLRVKALAGLLDKPMTAPIGAPEMLGSAGHRAIAREAVRKSLVLLKNEHGVLPLKANARVLVAGDGADNIAKQCGGWTISWQGTGNSNADFPNGISIYAGIRDALAAGGGEAVLSPDGSFTQTPDAAIVVFGEEPYAEFQGDLETLEYQPGDKPDLALLKRLRSQGIPVIALFISGRPLWVNAEINAADAFVAAWLPGTEGSGIADVLIRRPDGAVNFDFSGKLSFSWPRTPLQTALHHDEKPYDPLFAYGYGLTYRDRQSVAVLSEESGAPPGGLRNIGVYFGQGRAKAPWSLVLADKAGDMRVTASRQVSPAGIIEMRSIDVTAQEDGKTVTWSGAGPGTLAVNGRPVDLSRQSNGGMALTMRYRLDEPPTAPVRLVMSCGTDCSAAIDVSALLRAARAGIWQTLKVKLSCFAAAGADMARIENPMAITTAGHLGLSLAELRLEDDTGDALCPLAAR